MACSFDSVALVSPGAQCYCGRVTVKRGVLSWAASFVLAAVLLYFALRGVEWRAVWRIVAGARRGYLAICLVVASCSFFLRALRWRILLNAEGQLKVSTVFWGNMAGYLGNNFLPARAGELLRSVLISRHGGLSKAYVLTTALAERLADVIALVLASSLLLLKGVNPKPAWITQIASSMAVVAGAAALAIAVLPHTGRIVETVLLRLPLGRLRKSLLMLAEQVLLGLRAFHRWDRFAGFAVLTAAIWVADASAAIIVGWSLGLDIHFPVAMLLLTGLGLGSALPSTPGYVGIYQFVAVNLLGPFGIGRDGALAYILVLQVLGYIAVLFYGLCGLYALEWRTPLSGTRNAGVNGHGRFSGL
jgi:uncharacterized protein (TIRG00374 family)